MIAPKLLPWLAKRSGISWKRALYLWQAIEQEAEARFDATDSSRRNEFLAQRLREWAERESAVGADIRRAANPASVWHAVLDCQRAAVYGGFTLLRTWSALAVSSSKPLWVWPSPRRGHCGTAAD